MEGYEYINRKMEPRISNGEQEKSKEMVHELEIPFGDVEWKERGDISLESSGIHIDLTYEPSEKGKNWRKLVFLELRSVENEAGNRTDLLSDLIQDSTVHFKINNFDESSRMRTDGLVLEQSENILTPKGLIVFLHEVGHDVYRRFKEVNGIEQDRASLLGLLATSAFSDKEKLAESLRDERNASAYALKKLRPFLRNGSMSKSAALSLIHQEQLQKYAPYLRGATEGSVKSILKDIAFYLQDHLSDVD